MNFAFSYEKTYVLKDKTRTREQYKIKNGLPVNIVDYSTVAINPLHGL